MIKNNRWKSQQVHDFDLFKERVKQLHRMAVKGRFELEDLNLDVMVLDEILKNDIFLKNYMANPDKLLKHARLYPVAECQNFNDTYVGFSFIMEFPRVQESYPLYEVLQTGFYPEGKDTCVEVQETSQILIKENTLFSFTGCKTGLFGLCPARSLKRSLRNSCLNNSTYMNSCPVLTSNCDPYNIEEFSSGVLITSAGEVTVYSKTGFLIKTLKPKKSSFIRWTKKTHAVHVGERIIFNPKADESGPLTMNTTYMAEYDYKDSLFHHVDDQAGSLNMTTIRELKTMNKRMNNTVDNINLQFNDMASELGIKGILLYATLSATFFFIIIYIAGKLRNIYIREKPPINDKRMP